MVINEKALLTQMKEAYSKQGGYTVAVVGDYMMFTNGTWVAVIERDNVPSELLGLMAQHIRDIPGQGQAYTVYKVKGDTIAQSRILTEAIQPWTHLANRKEEGMGGKMRRTSLTLRGMLLWQEVEGENLYMIDPRYAVLFANGLEQTRLGNGIFAEGEISQLWVLRNVDGALEEPLEYLQKVRWVE